MRAGLLAAARDLFLDQGFAATGIDQICAAASVTKGALFHHFGSKRDLALEVLNAWTRAGFEAYARGAFLRAPSAVARAFGYVDFTIELARAAPIGCLIGCLAQETSASHPAVRQRCAAAFRDWSGGLATMLEQARREVQGAVDFDSAVVARHFVAVFEGAQILAKASRSRAPVEEHLLQFRSYLEYLLGTKGRRARTRRGHGNDAAP